MSIPVIRGVNQPLVESVEITFDPTRGFVTTTVYSLPSGSNNDSTMAALANFLTYSGIAISQSFKGGVYRITAVDSTLNNPIDNWELTGDDERLDLFQNPLWSGQITADQMATLRQYLSNNSTTDTAFADPILSPLKNGVVQRAYNRYQAGNDVFLNSAYGSGYVLRHTTNVPNRWGQNLADTNVGKIYLLGSFLSEISSPANWVFPCPFSLQYAINIATAACLSASQGLPGGATYQVGWLKQRSNRESVANNRVNIQTTYTLNFWNTDDYFTF